MMNNLSKENSLSLAFSEIEKRNFPLAKKILNPHKDSSDALHQLAYIAFQENNFDEAIELYQSVIIKDTTKKEAYKNLILLLICKKEMSKALKYACFYLQKYPNEIEIIKLLISDEINPYTALIIEPCLEKVFNANQDHFDVLYFYGFYQFFLGNINKSFTAFEKALTLQPGDATISIAYSRFLNQENQLEKALSIIEIALMKYPKNIRLLTNLGAIHSDMGNHTVAIEAFEKVLSLEPNNTHARYNLGIEFLRTGQLKQGWQYYESGLELNDGRNSQAIFEKFTYPKWQGESLMGKKIIIWSEQGIGDEIIFSSCIPDLINQGADCFLACSSKLVPLLTSSLEKLKVFDKSEVDPYTLSTYGNFDYQVFLGSLPCHLRTRIVDFPNNKIFLNPTSEKQASAKKWLSTLPQGLTVGIVWRSTLRDPLRNRLYPALEHWKPVFSCPKVNFISLQYNLTEEERVLIKKEFNIELYEDTSVDLFNDIESTCALIQTLDLVIGVDTTNTMMAASLGKKTFMLNHHIRSYFALGEDYFPWFQDSHIFNQTSPGDWASVMNPASHALRLLNSEA